MRKGIFVILLLSFAFLGGVGSVSALEPYGQFDILVNRPLHLGAGNLEKEFDNYEEVNEFSRKYPIVIPDLRGHLFMEAGPTRIGLGARGFSAILETVLWPTLTAEVDLGPVRLTGSMGGGLFGFIGLFNDIHTGRIWLPELTAAYMFNDWFHIGLSGTGVYLPEMSSDSLGFVGSIFARFSIDGRD
ncbi:MAG: hypothetical protein ACLFMZ_00400 [Spirochaetaceae bacterium]